MVVQRVQSSKKKLWWSVAFVQHWMFFSMVRFSILRCTHSFLCRCLGQWTLLDAKWMSTLIMIVDIQAEIMRFDPSMTNTRIRECKRKSHHEVHERFSLPWSWADNGSGSRTTRSWGQVVWVFARWPRREMRFQVIPSCLRTGCGHCVISCNCEVFPKWKNCRSWRSCFSELLPDLIGSSRHICEKVDQWPSWEYSKTFQAFQDLYVADSGNQRLRLIFRQVGTALRQSSLVYGICLSRHSLREQVGSVRRMRGNLVRYLHSMFCAVPRSKSWTLRKVHQRLPVWGTSDGHRISLIWCFFQSALSTERLNGKGKMLDLRDWFTHGYIYIYAYIYYTCLYTQAYIVYKKKPLASAGRWRSLAMACNRQTSWPSCQSRSSVVRRPCKSRYIRYIKI